MQLIFLFLFVVLNIFYNEKRDISINMGKEIEKKMRWTTVVNSARFSCLREMPERIWEPAQSGVLKTQ